MHILVTGGAGYIGSHVVKQLLETTGHDITIIDNLSTGHQKTLDPLESIISKTVSGIDFTVQTLPRRAGDSARLVSDNTKIKKILGWEPKYHDLALICKTALDWKKKICEPYSQQIEHIHFFLTNKQA